jgi:hypothetical protein
MWDLFHRYIGREMKIRLGWLELIYNMISAEERIDLVVILVSLAVACLFIGVPPVFFFRRLTVKFNDITSFVKGNGFSTPSLPPATEAGSI